MRDDGTLGTVVWLAEHRQMERLIGPLSVAVSRTFRDGKAISAEGFPEREKALEVAARLAGLAELGIERLIVVPGSLDADPEAVEEANARLAAEVLPALR